MTLEKRTVTVKQVPEDLDLKQERKFLREIENSMDGDRPRMVLDCSNVRQIDKPVIHLLLSCLAEAMKRNGDVRLAGLPPGAEAILAHAGAGRIFDIYDTTADAVNSFRHLPSGGVSQVAGPVHSNRKPDGAA